MNVFLIIFTLNDMSRIYLAEIVYPPPNSYHWLADFQADFQDPSTKIF